MGYETIKAEDRKARKPHRCAWCGEKIEVGTVYRYVRGKLDGEDPQDGHYHPECDRAVTELAAEEGGSCEFSIYDNERPPSPTGEPK